MWKKNVYDIVFATSLVKKHNKKVFNIKETIEELMSKLDISSTYKKINIKKGSKS